MEVTIHLYAAPLSLYSERFQTLRKTSRAHGPRAPTWLSLHSCSTGRDSNPGSSAPGPPCVATRQAANRSAWARRGSRQPGDDAKAGVRGKARGRGGVCEGQGLGAPVPAQQAPPGPAGGRPPSRRKPRGLAGRQRRTERGSRMPVPGAAVRGVHGCTDQSAARYANGGALAGSEEGRAVNRALGTMPPQVRRRDPG